MMFADAASNMTNLDFSGTAPDAADADRTLMWHYENPAAEASVGCRQRPGGGDHVQYSALGIESGCRGFPA